ncbi:MAG: heparinase II/III family protein [Bryobacterales bacterium]|nr:heparinase II/III family protein [Bryobacterales bacterium]
MRTILSLLLLFVMADAKDRSVFFPPDFIERAKANAQRHPWAAAIQQQIVRDAQPWMRMSTDELWSLMFGPNITRSHMVWSAGFCPGCRNRVPMYDWEIDAHRHPWKVRCPHCREFFPKNDFAGYHRSGLNEQGIFEPKRANRKLLFNTEHPDPADPKHRFGVDDGEGYVEGSNRWRFIGAYLPYGQYGQLIENGIARLSAAYMVTDDTQYAHRAAILLDRVADIWPEFDYGEQGLVYERARYGGGVSGYVFYSIDSAYNVRRLTLAYDQIFEAARRDPALVSFLAAKAAQYKLPNPKRTFADIQKNFEDRVLRDVLANPLKIRTNYPGTESALALIRTVLNWPANRAEVASALNEIVAVSTEVDGLTGEKGLAGYSAIAPRYLAELLELYGRADSQLLSEILARQPNLRKTYRFFADTWSARQYYPHTGDSGAFAIRSTQYAGLSFDRPHAGGKFDIDPPVSSYSFLWRLHKATSDPFYAQLIHLGSQGKFDELPLDIFATAPGAMQRELRDVIARHGPLPEPGSVHYSQWRLGILRPKRNPAAAALWLDYDSIPEGRNKGHLHFDAMNIGLFAKGLDLLPEFGYPAVQFGDWHTPQALWHKMTAAHNTVVVDGQNQKGGPTEATLWADGDEFRAIRASSPSQIGGSQYERTVAMAGTGADDIYVFDVFRVRGGTDHAKFTHSHFGTITTSGLILKSSPDYGNNTLTRNFQSDSQAASGWSADWKIEDRYRYLPAGSNVHFRYTDLTEGAEASTLESWTVKNLSSTEEFWIPTVMVRRRAAQGPLASTFVSVMEPYEGTSRIKAIRRLKHEDVAVEVELISGAVDRWTTAGDGLTWVRRDAKGRPERAALCHSTSLRDGDLQVSLTGKPQFVELQFRDGRASATGGDAASVKAISIGGRRVRIQQ